MAKDHSIRCHGCSQPLINYNDFSRPQVCPACFEQLSLAERIQVKTLAQIQEHLRHEAIMSEHRDSDDNQTARLAKAIERLTVVLNSGSFTATPQPPKHPPGYGPSKN